MFDSHLEKTYSLTFNIPKNDTSFVILDGCAAPNYKPIRDVIEYTPDFIEKKENFDIWIEVKGFHRNMDAYFLRRKLIIRYCKKNLIAFHETTLTNHKWKTIIYYSPSS